MSSVTLRTIAKALDLSPGTVSRSLNGHPDIGPATRMKVLEAAKRMNYQLPSDRSIFASKKLRGIGLLVGNRYSECDRSFVGFHNLESIGRAAAARNIMTQVAFVDVWREQAVESFDVHAYFSRNMIDGVVLLYPFPTALIEQINTMWPVVSVEHAYPGLPVDVIGPTQTLDVTHAVLHLAELGHQRIGYIADEAATGMQITQGQRFGGYLSGMHAAGLNCRHEDVVNMLGPAVSKTDLAQVICDKTRQGVTAWVCSIDRHAYLLWHQLPAMGIRVPEDVSLTGIGGVGAIDLPQLTTCRLPYDAISEAAIHRLAHRLVNRDSLATFTEFQSTFINGVSTAPPGKSVQ